jgi:hypothetical protein
LLEHQENRRPDRGLLPTSEATHKVLISAPAVGNFMEVTI